MLQAYITVHDCSNARNCLQQSPKRIHVRDGRKQWEAGKEKTAAGQTHESEPVASPGMIMPVALGAIPAAFIVALAAAAD